MNKKIRPTAIDRALNSIESPFIRWIADYGIYLLIGLIVLLLSFLIIHRIIFMASTPSDIAYIEASQNFAVFEQTLENPANKDRQATVILTLERIMREHPSLQARYDGLLAEGLFIQGESTEAIPFAERTLDRVKVDQFSLYSAYASNTVLIEADKIEEALEKTKTLQDSLINPENTPTLFVLNSLRLIFLNQMMGEQEAAKIQWKLLKELAANEKIQTILSKFTIGNYTLTDYFQNLDGLSEF